MTLRLDAVFSDHMVLCRNKEIRLFGDAESGSTVTASLNGAVAAAVASHGRFEVSLPPLSAGGPYVLTVDDGATTLMFHDVLIGEVYLAGGQSNMELELQNADDGHKLMVEADNDSIRFLNFPKQAWLDDAALEAERKIGWKVLKPNACGDVSAVAFHFATRLQAELGVPVGVIDCYIGGTSVACWIDEATLRESAAGTYYLTDYEMQCAGKTVEQFDRENLDFTTKLDAWNAEATAFRASHIGADWDQVVAACGACPWNPPVGCKSPYRPAGLADTMLKRVAPYTLTGALYYQGEADAPRHTMYATLMSTLIVFWRKLFRDLSLPFVFVQLPMFIDKGVQDDFTWPWLRVAQAEVAETVANTAMVVLIDCGEFNNIHPTDKATVGDRLFRQVLKLVYGKDADGDSPRVLAKRTDGNALVLTVSAPIHAVGGEAKLFELSQVEGEFVPAKVELNGCEIRLTSDGVEHPTQARYAWANYALVNVFGDNGLPLAPFLTK